MENRVKAKLKNGEYCLGIRIVESRSLGVLSILAENGIDWVFFDCEHGSYSWETVLNFNRYCNAIGLCPIVKVPALDYHLISRPLDQGAMGIIVPLIETKAQAEEAVKFCRYPPAGERGCGLDNDYFGWKSGAREYMEWANKNILLILQIESRRGIENIEEIAQAKGIDILFAGPLDLSVSLGVPGEVSHPKVIECFKKMRDVCMWYGLEFGFAGYMKSADAWSELGSKFICFGSDTTILAAGCREKVSSFRNIVGLA